MVCLAVCDVLLLMSTFGVSVYAVDLNWTLGTLFCKLEMVFGAVAADCIICTTAIIGIDRYVDLMSL